MVDVLKPPFRLVRNGWGEFPLRIQIFFNESLDIKHPPIDYVHRIKLDPSCSGVARIGEERFVDLEIDRSYTEALFNARHAVESEDGKRLPVPVRVKIERRGDGDTMGVEDVTEERSGEAHAMEEAEALLLEPPEDQPGAWKSTQRYLPNDGLCNGLGPLVVWFLFVIFDVFFLAFYRPLPSLLHVIILASNPSTELEDVISAWLP